MNFFDFGEVINLDTQFVVFGIPWDYLSSVDSANSAVAPKKIREVSDNLGLTTEMGFEIPKLKIVDIGNVQIDSTNVEKNLNEIREFVNEIYKQKSDIIPVMIGGDHFCSYPVIKAVGENFHKREEFGVLIFDAHLDLYEKWDKGVYSHATVSHRIYDLEFVHRKNLLIVGTRDIDVAELKTAEKENISYLNAYNLIENDLESFTGKIMTFFNQSNLKNLYVSIDIDALDPSIAPGTGYAIPGGFTYREIWKILKELAIRFTIIGFDLVEVSPNLDLPNNLTLNLAAKLIIEFISFINNKKENNTI